MAIIFLVRLFIRCKCSHIYSSIST